MPFTAFATFLSFVFSEGEAVIYPTPGPCEGGSDPGRARVIIQHVRIFGSQNRHTDMKEPTEG